MRTRSGNKKVEKPFPLETLLKTWPWNLVSDIVTRKYDYPSDDKEAYQKAVKENQLFTAKLYVPGFLEVLEDLTDREQKVLRLRYEEGMTYEQTGNEFGVTRERIRQVEEKAMRKLRNPFFAKQYILVDAKTTQDLKKENEDLMLQVICLRDKLKKIYDAVGVNPDEAEKKAKEAVKPEPKHLPSIDEMELSVRSYNCLKRAGFNTIDQLKGKTSKDLMRVRNLGRKSMIEVITKAKEWGITIPMVAEDGDD